LHPDPYRCPPSRPSPHHTLSIARRAILEPRNPPPDGLKTAAQAAARLNCSTKTLDGYVKAGAIGYVIIGHGKKRPRKMFTDADLNEFIANQTRKDVPCPSTASRARHSGIMISGGTVIDFTAPRKPPTDAKRKK
jgi:hypothetical protein